MTITITTNITISTLVLIVATSWQPTSAGPIMSSCHVLSYHSMIYYIVL